MENDQLWNFLLTPSGIMLSMVITFGVVGIYAYLVGQFRE
ncbi:Membrane protein [Vibrio mytili]|uniref:Membrane protein n=1 Tax=Vibrio mytili TaxID=50718 RepID=A0A0C3HUY5_9VIBR|nr:membrane protein [Vibrio mytili]